MKKAIWGIIIVILVAGLAVGGYFYVKSRKDTAANPDLPEVYVTNVGQMMGLSGSTMGGNGRFAGVVEAQKTMSVSIDAERTVLERLVEVDDIVKEGDVLLTYDTQETEMELESHKLALERLENSLDAQEDKIEELEKQSKDATGDVLLQYTIEIQDAKAALKQIEYDIEAKEMEIDRVNSTLDNSVLLSPMDGIIRSIGRVTDEFGQSSEAITIIANGAYRIKGLINEQNVYTLNMGEPVTIRSRVDENRTWSGYIAEIDTSSPDNSSNQDYYFYGQDPMTQSSKYPFYIELDSYEELMMGQHVYIEIGAQGAEEAPEKEGVWIYEDYISFEDGNLMQGYVFVMEKGRIVKRNVTLGNYDDQTFQYEITSGLSLEDYIAWPDETVAEGAPAIPMQ